MQFGIGTAQFGMDYGISNQNGKTPINELIDILDFAKENQICLLDTAITYGDSESILGTLVSKKHNFRIITKTPVFKKRRLTHQDADNLKLSFYKSLEKLKQPKIAGLLIHHADDLLNDGGEFLFATMQTLKKDRLVEKIGVSVYTGEQIDLLLEKYDFDLIQLPINVLDQRLIDSGYFFRLKERGIEVHVRSIFLQGLLLMDPELLHPFFSPIKPLLNQYRVFLQSKGLDYAQGALAFIKQIPEIDYIIIGVNNVEQLKSNWKDFIQHNNIPLNDFTMFSVKEEKYINPSLWDIKDE